MKSTVRHKQPLGERFRKPPPLALSEFGSLVKIQAPARARAQLVEAAAQAPAEAQLSHAEEAVAWAVLSDPRVALRASADLAPINRFVWFHSALARPPPAAPAARQWAARLAPAPPVPAPVSGAAGPCRNKRPRPRRLQ